LRVWSITVVFGVEDVKRFPHPIKPWRTQARVIVGARNWRDAYRKLTAARVFGFDDSFYYFRHYATITGNAQEIELAQDGSIWFCHADDHKKEQYVRWQ